MIRNANRPEQIAGLRLQAEEIARDRMVHSPKDICAMSPDEIRRMIYNLEVYQVELEMQNKELRQRQVELDASQAHYFAFYDLAPVGYFTINEENLILEANLTAAGFLGVDKGVLVKKSLCRFILDSDQDVYYHHRRSLSASGASQKCDLRMVRNDGMTFWACLTSTFTHNEDGSLLCRIVMTDITERKRSEEHFILFRDIISAIPDRVALIGPNYEYLLVNEAYERFFGISRKTIIGQKVAEIGGEEAFQQKIQPYLDRSLQGEIVHFQEWFNYPTMGNKLIDVSYYPFKDAQNHVTGVISYLRDITKSDAAEAKLRESEAKYHSAYTLMRMLCDNVPDMIWAKDLQKRYIFANKAICSNLLNASDAGEPIGKVDMFFAERERARHPDNPQWHTFGEICRDTDALTMESGSPQQFDEYGNVQGKFLFLDVRKAPFIDKDGRMIGTVGSARDVTSAKKMEQELRESEDRYRLLFDSTLDAILLTAPDGKIFAANSAACHMFEQTEEEITKGGRIGIMDTSDPRLGPALEQRNQTGKFTGELTCIRRGNIQFPVELSSSIYHDKDGNAKAGIIIRDITDRKQAEEALQASLAEKEVLLREVHHRVKNNMAAIISLLNLHCQAMKDPHVEAVLAELSSRVRAMSLVHEKLYRSESLARIDFQDYLQSLISHLRTSFGAPGIRCEIHASGVEMPLDLAVPCGMIINELVVNALKYAFPEKQTETAGEIDRIIITMTHDNGSFSLSVADNGIGLSPGFDLNTAQTLGLVLVRMLGQHQLGGRYKINRFGGTRFTLTFSQRNGRKAYE